MSQHEPARPLSELLLEISEMLAPVTEFCVGQRAQFEAAGYSPAMAERIAAEIHIQLIQSAFSRRQT